MKVIWLHRELTTEHHFCGLINHHTESSLESTDWKSFLLEKNWVFSKRYVPVKVSAFYEKFQFFTLTKCENAICLQTPPNISSVRHDSVWWAPCIWITRFPALASCFGPFWGKDPLCYVCVQYQGTAPSLIWDNFVLMQYPVKAIIVIIHLNLEWK